MNVFRLTIFSLVFAMTGVHAGHYETYAFGDTEAKACEQARSDLEDQAILECRMSGASFEKAEYGKCRIAESSGGRHKAVRSVVFSCKQN